MWFGLVNMFDDVAHNAAAQVLGKPCDRVHAAQWLNHILDECRAYPKSIDPASVQYIEAHCTSTQLGDATELAALTRVLGRRAAGDAKIPIASVKANIGHTVEAAGIAGLIKAVLAMHHEVVPPAINYETPNPNIVWEDTPFFVPTAPVAWPLSDDGTRRGGINAFGIGGLNAHVVVESPIDGNAQSFAISRVSSPNNGAVRPSDDEIAIVGQGAVFPGALTVKAFADLLTTARDVTRDITPNRWNTDIYYDPRPGIAWRSPSRRAGIVEDFAYDWRRHSISPKQLETADPLQFMILDTADQALDEAGYAGKPFDRTRTGVVVGTIIGDEFYTQLAVSLHLPELEQDLRRCCEERGLGSDEIARIVETFRNVFLERYTALRDESGSFSSSTLASRIAKSMDLMGGAFTLDAGEASSLAAVAVGRDLLLSGPCDLVFCAGAQRHLSIDAFESYGIRGLLASDDPAARRSDRGILLGEGVGTVLLKRLTDARRDRDNVLAIVHSIDAASNVKSINEAVAMARARAAHGLDAGDYQDSILSIDIADDGQAAMAADQETAQAVFADPLTRQIGHTLAASGMASLFQAIHTLQEASAGTGEHEESYVAGSGPATREACAYAYSGLAYCTVVKRGELNKPMEAVAFKPTPDSAPRIIRIGAETMEALSQRIARVDSASLFDGASLSRYTAADHARVAIVAASPDALADQLALARAQIHNADARALLEEHGIFCRVVEAEAPLVAFLFPGQGSQYLGMLRDWGDLIPKVAAKRRDLDAELLRLGCASFAGLAWEDGDPSGDVWRTQASILVADILMLTAITTLTGIVPDVISAHSYGEYPALVAAGAWTFEQALRVTRRRCEMIAADSGPLGRMLATTASPETINRLSQGIPGVLCKKCNTCRSVG